MDQRYIVFLNDRTVELTEIINNADFKPVNIIIRFETTECLESEYKRFKSALHCEKLIIFCENRFDEAVSAFNSLFHAVPASGGIVINKTGQCLFIRRNGYWDLPKGKREAGESQSACALREVQEETGLSMLKIISPLPSTFHIYPDARGREILKETTWFEMFFSGVEHPVPQEEEGITEVRWFSPEELPEAIQNAYASVRELIGKYNRLKRQ
jgi:8-oxo-dGTP pyrophosphatase MutT (NUDIX family)